MPSGPVSFRVASAVLAGGVAAATLLTAVPAQAAAAPRIKAGTWQVKMTITAEQNTLNFVGQTATRPWIFKPKCATGGCATTLDRQRLTSTTFTRYALKPVLVMGSYQYKGATNSTTDCYNDDGSLRFAGAYATSESVALVPGKVVAGTVTRFTGIFTLKLTPTPAAAAKGCRKGSARADVVSVSAP